MSDPAIGIERRYLLIAAAGNLVLGCVGMVVASAASSQAILLDGLFNITYFVTGLFTLKIAHLVARGDDERFPHGYSFFEPLINGVKGLLVLGVSVVALVGAVQAVLAGGSPISAGMAVVYGIFASVLCWIMAGVTRRGARRTESPLIVADATNWIVNAAVSTGVLVAFSANYFIGGTALEFL
ncbi:MAG: cation transporter, partial [Planctomycetota bacterium]